MRLVGRGAGAGGAEDIDAGAEDLRGRVPRLAADAERAIPPGRLGVATSSVAELLPCIASASCEITLSATKHLTSRSRIVSRIRSCSSMGVIAC